MDAVIRPRHDSDLDDLVDGLAQVAATDGYPDRWPDDPAGWLRPADALQAWVAQLGDAVVGHVVLRQGRAQGPVRLWCTTSGEHPASCAVLSRLFVVASARGHRVGRALVEVAAGYAAEHALRPLLDVAETNAAAVRLYRRLGWTHVGSYEETFHEGGPPVLLLCFAGPLRGPAHVTEPGPRSGPAHVTEPGPRSGPAHVTEPGPRS